MSSNPATTPIQNTRVRFSLMEFSGGLGDLGTFIPLTVALSLATGMDIGIILIFAGLFNISTGLLFGLPIPVQPMKAIAAVAIAEQLLPEEIAAAGLIVGAVLFLLGITGWIEKVERFVPRPVIRGIQLGIGVKLAISGIGMIVTTELIGFDSIATGLGLGILALLLGRINRFPTALALFAVGAVGIIYIAPPDLIWPGLTLPVFSLALPDMNAFANGLLRGALPQLPLTMLNSVLAVCVLSGDLFPGRRVPTGRMALSVGLMNLFSCGFGAMPMCHGSGGLAGQYRFGARTGGSVIMLGTMKLIAGLFFGTAAAASLLYFPMSILGLMLTFAGIELASPAKDQKKPRAVIIMLLTAILIVAVNTAVGFVVGTVAAFLVERRSRKLR